MLKASLKPVGALPATEIDNSNFVGSSSKNDRKSAKSNFSKPMHKVKKSSFLTPNTRQAFT